MRSSWLKVSPFWSIAIVDEIETGLPGVVPALRDVVRVVAADRGQREASG